jgi:hypothetical protein
LDEDKVYSATCGETLFNHPILSKENLKVGLKLKIKCMQGCPNEEKLVFGSEIYDETTAICASAFHSGAIDE